MPGPRSLHGVGGYAWSQIPSGEGYVRGGVEGEVYQGNTRGWGGYTSGQGAHQREWGVGVLEMVYQRGRYTRGWGRYTRGGSGIPPAPLDMGPRIPTTTPTHTVSKWTVGILLECFLVLSSREGSGGGTREVWCGK